MKVAFFDIDKTIYNDHSFFQIAANELRERKIDIESWNSIQHLVSRYRNAELSYTEAANQLLIVFAFALKNQKYQELYDDCRKFFFKNKQNFFPYFERILRNLSNSHDIYLVTTNTQFVAEAVVDLFNLKGFISTEFEIKNGLFTGKVTRSLADGKEMISNLLELYGRNGSIAVGDSGNDISMLKLVEHPLCINPDDELKDYALQNNWPTFNDEEAEEVLSKIILVKKS